MPKPEDIAATYAFLLERKRSYQTAFSSPQSQNALIDLSDFCRANETCVVPGDRDRTLVLEGRREVWLRIQQHLNLTPEQLFQLFAGQALNTNGDDNG